MIENHTYYLPKFKKIIGNKAEEIGYLLVSLYFQKMGNECFLCDGVSYYTKGEVEHVSIVRGKRNDRGEIKYYVESIRLPACLEGSQNFVLG